ncbi:MAG: uroporphyrinogen-III C-methyltransferase, partial [Proteobacteria bacterium]|nr:uroporphyrinogen-III C-methyltransferase [Pseudomonadota bacterium]
VVAVGYTIYEDWRVQRDLLLNSGNIEASITNLASRIDSAKQSLAEVEAELDVLDLADKRVERRLRLLDTLPARTDSLEAAITALQRVSNGARESWLLREAAYYLQLANAQLQLAGNPELASLALGVADERIVELSNPALTNVRMAIADERAALDGMTTPDIEGITLKLSSLARTVATLPMRRIERSSAPAVDELPADASSLDRAWHSIRRATSGLVRHNTIDETVMPLISPEAEYFLRANMALQLQTARLALLRGEQSAYAESLADASSWLETYFDVSSNSVKAALQLLATLPDGMQDIAKPDISGSLQLLRRYSSVSETTQ